MSHAQAKADVAGKAKLLVVLLAFAWGFNWIGAAVALREVPPWSLRFSGAGIGAATLFAAALLTGHDLRVPRGQRLPIVVAGFFNVVAFNMFAAFAQLGGATSRVVIVAYSMPIWAALLGRFMLHERLDGARLIGLALCVSGLTILLWPLFAGGLPPSVFWSLGCALSWAFATVYMKWVKSTVEPLANAAWQLLFGCLLLGVGMLAFEHYPRLWPLQTPSLLAVIYIGVLGTGLAHFLWWSVIGRLPTVTASIGVLLVPVVGVTASTIFLGERPTLSDIIGFAMIFAAAACVLLQPNVKHTEMPE
ncbi:MAG TPA: EamA family transporter [Pseudolabrys sp.]|jgi:drug/metabolite transporter (DMT)-like permease